MNINNLTSLLLELSYERNSKATPVDKTEGVFRVRDSESNRHLFEAARSAGRDGQPARASNSQAGEQQVQSQPSFTPLPWRTGLFREARFFARTGDEKYSGTTSGKPSREIFICLVTEHLGVIWAGITHQEQALHVRYFTDNEDASKLMRENFAALRKDLNDTGFAVISLSSRARTELSAIEEGQIPRFEQHLINRVI